MGIRSSDWGPSAVGNRRIVLAMLAVVVSLAVPASAGAAISVADFSGGGGGSGMNAQNVAGAPTPNHSAMELVIPNATPGVYAGVRFSGIPTAPASTPPSFFYESTVTGPASGSPRMVITFSDGDSIFLAPSTWTAYQWTTESGSGDDWSDAGAGGCQPRANLGYSQA